MNNDDYEQFMDNGRRWRELLPEGRYAWPLYDWDTTDSTEPPLIGYVIHQRCRKGALKIWLAGADPSRDVREISAALRVAEETYENGDVEYRLACIVESPEEYASRYGMHSGKCGFCERKLRDPQSVERGIGPECLKKIGGAR